MGSPGGQPGRGVDPGRSRVNSLPHRAAALRQRVQLIYRFYLVDILEITIIIPAGQGVFPHKTHPRGEHFRHHIIGFAE